MAWQAILTWIASNWRIIAALIGLAVMGVAGYTVGSAIVQAQPAFQQAISIATYAIPLMAYMMAIQFVFQTISMVREFFSKK